MRVHFGIHEFIVVGLTDVYRELVCHIIFYLKMGEKLCCKSLMLSGRHNTTAPSYLIYSLVVYQDSVSIVLKISALNYFRVIA